jgi:hypothetical protein
MLMPMPITVAVRSGHEEQPHAGGNEKCPELIGVPGTLMKEGGDLLSHIALQYHRRRRA